MIRFMLAAILAIILPCFSFAAEARPDRPHWSLELKGGAFLPQAGDWSRFYDSGHVGEFGGALSYKVHRQVEVGLEGSYARAKGSGQQPVHGLVAGRVTHEQVPLNLFVLARGVFSEDQWVVPYAGGGWTRMFYRQKVEDQGKTQGSVNGYHVRGGVQLLLDRLESDAANDLYLDFGVHHTYLFLEARHTRAKAGTVPAGSVNIGGTSYLGGLLFEF